MLTLHLTRGNYYEGVYLRLPATPGEVGEVFSWLDEVDTEAPTKIIDVVSNIPNLHRYMYRVDIDSEGVLGKLQKIAAMTNEISGHQRDIVTGALDAESINGLDDIISVIERVDEYAFIPGITCDKELGGYLVESGYMDFPERVKPYLDYQGIGAEYYADHGGAYTNKGYDIMTTLMLVMRIKRHWNLASKVFTNSTKGASTSRRLVDVFFLAMTLGIEQGGACKFPISVPRGP